MKQRNTDLKNLDLETGFLLAVTTSRGVIAAEGQGTQLAPVWLPGAGFLHFEEATAGFFHHAGWLGSHATAEVTKQGQVCCDAICHYQKVIKSN